MSSLNSVDIQSMIIAPGDIYWVRALGKRVLIARAGQVLDTKILKKFEGKDVKLELEEDLSIPIEDRDLLITKFSLLKEEKLEMNRVALVRDILEIVFIKYNRQISFSDLVRVGIESFYQFDFEVTEALTNIDVRLFQRSAIVGIYAVLLAMTAGYFDYRFLKDIYHISYFFDCYFSIEQVSYYITEALEKERCAGEGKQFLRGKEVELENFEKHPEESFRIAKRKFKKFIEHKEMFQIIRMHHEKIDGSGFTSGLNDEDFNDIERILIFLSESLPFKELSFSADEGKDFLMQNIIMGRGKMYLSPRIAKIIEETFSVLEKREAA
jgi:hypothetical protein